MKFISGFVLLVTLACVYCDCGCIECSKGKIHVIPHDCDHEVKVMYRGTPCECQKALPYRVEIPEEPKPVKLGSYGYKVEHLPRPGPVHRYIYNTKIEQPLEFMSPKLCSYPIKVQRLYDQVLAPRYRFNTKIEVPVEEKVKLRDCVAKLDRVVLPAPDCPQPCCKQDSSEEKVRVIKKKVYVQGSAEGSASCEKKKKVIVKSDSSEQVVSADDSYEYPRQYFKKVFKVRKDSGEDCSKHYVSTEDASFECNKRKIVVKPDSSEETYKTHVSVENVSCGCQKQKKKVCADSSMEYVKPVFSEESYDVSDCGCGKPQKKIYYRKPCTRCNSYSGCDCH